MNGFFGLVATQLWQMTVLIIAVAILNRWLSRRSAHLAHLLWLVVLLKMFAPPVWNCASGLFCWLQPDRVVVTASTAEQFSSEGIWSEFSLDETTQPLPSGSAAGQPLSASDAVGQRLLEETQTHETDPTAAPIWQSAMMIGWLAASVIVAGGIGLRWWLFWRRLRRYPVRESAVELELLSELTQRLRIRRRVRLVITESPVGPAVVGLFRITILLPTAVVERLSSEAFRPILAHELLHIRRGDLWIGMVQLLARVIWWFHPLVWWASRMTRQEAERCCDEQVLAELKCRPADYARALVEVLELKSQLQPVPVFPGVRPMDVTTQRLERIMSLRQGSRSRAPMWCWICAMLAAAASLPGAAFIVNADEPQKADTQALPAPPLPETTGTVRVRVADGVDHAVATNEPLQTVVFDLSEWQHLFPDGRMTRQQFEILIKHAAGEESCLVSWHGDNPVVRCQRHVSSQVAATLDLLSRSGASPEDVTGLLQSMQTPDDVTLRIRMRLIEMSPGAANALLAASGSDSGSQGTLESFEQLDQTIREVREEFVNISAPQIIVTKGAFAHVEIREKEREVQTRNEQGEWVGGSEQAGTEMRLLAFPATDDSIALSGVAEILAAATESADAMPDLPPMARLERGFTTSIQSARVQLFEIPPANRFQQARGAYVLAVQVEPVELPLVHLLSGVGV
ncbi:MAG: M56 family metallopeptidase, partial [Planctomycetaceae bacterium]|nr:M56 family metallopeptidase [Planctomycetaceae bacterium]